MISEENDLSDTSKSAKRSCRQKSSDGCTGLGMSVIPSGSTLPSKTGQVPGVGALAIPNPIFPVQSRLEESRASSLHHPDDSHSHDPPGFRRQRRPRRGYAPIHAPETL